MSATVTTPEAPRAAPHKVSAPARHAATAILEHVEITVKPDCIIKNLQPDHRCLAILIDLTSNIYHVTALRPELGYWQRRVVNENASFAQLNQFLRKLIGAMELSEFPEEAAAANAIAVPLPAEARGMRRHGLSPAALHAANGVAQCYSLSWKDADLRAKRQAPSVQWVARMLDIYGGFHRSARLLPFLRKKYAEFVAGQMTPQEAADFFKFIGIHLDSMPFYREREDEAQSI